MSTKSWWIWVGVMESIYCLLLDWYVSCSKSCVFCKHSLADIYLQFSETNIYIFWLEIESEVDQRDQMLYAKICTDTSTSHFPNYIQIVRTFYITNETRRFLSDGTSCLFFWYSYGDDNHVQGSIIDICELQ